MNRQALETLGAVAINLPPKRRHALRRYGLAVALASVALLIRGALPVPQGTSIYLLPLAAVVLSGWFGGREAGLVALVICAAGILYWFIPPADSLSLPPEYALGLGMFIALGVLLTEFSAGRARAEHALRESEERFRALVQFSFDVYWESDAQHRFTRQEFSERLTDGPVPGSEIGKTRWQIPHVEPDEEAWRKHRATLDAHLPFRDFELARPADGGRRYVSVSGLPAFDQSGRFVGYRGVGRHITDRKHAEAEHRAHVWFLESLDRINRAIQSTNDLDQMLGRALDEVFDIFQCDRAVLGRHSGESETASFTRLAKRERPGFVLDLNLGVEVAADEGLTAMSAGLKAVRGPVQWVLGSIPPRIAQHLERVGVQSVLSMPIEPKTERPDYFYVFTLRQCTYPRVWTPEEERLFLEIGRRLGDATTMLSTLRDLRASERKLEASQRLAHVGWWERDYATGRVSLSDEACRIFGVQPLELPQWHGRWLSLIHPEDRENAAAASDLALRGGPRYDVEYRVVRPDGAVRVVHSQGDVTREESGRPVRQFGVMQDITELRQAEDELRASEAALRESEARFRTFADRATDAFFLLDEQLNVIDVNREACDGLGWSHEELIGMHPGHFDVGLDASSIAQLAARAESGETITFETRHRRKDGTVFPVEIRTGTFRREGKLFYLALARDISERKQAEERTAKLAAIVESSHDAIIGKDLNGIITTWNTGAERIFGYAAREVIGQSVTILLPPDRVDELRGILERIRRGERVDHFETVRRRKDGTLLDISLSVSPIIDGSGNVVGASKVARDISERKLAEETLREKDHALEITRTELARVSRLTTLGELTTSIVHEVSQPLGAMVASAAAGARWLAAEPPDIAEARSALDNIAADGKRAREVIARIRALTKRQVPRMELLDVNRKILDVVALTERELRSHEIVLQTELDGTLPRVAGDRVQLQQVLLNLIVNAIEAMSGIHDRSRELTIVSERDGPSAVAVEVRDSGAGLKAEGAEQVFEAFYTTKAEGIGIGLSISRSIVEAHGGRLTARPNEPYGAAFRFSLPLAGDGQS